MHSPQEYSVIIIVVSYNSDQVTLESNLTHLASHYQIVICDNSTDSIARQQIEEFCSKHDIVYLRMPGNTGIGFAQNQGIHYARTKKARFVLLLDDDSTFLPEMVDHLVHSFLEASDSGKNIGLLGARARNLSGKDLSNVPPGSNGLSHCPLMTSSGSLIPLEVLRQVGGMDESLFIDYVDFEWGWRAIDKGFQLYLDDNLYFDHHLGEGEVRKFGLTLRIPSPIRHYYQTRNFLLLASRSHVPWRWKLRQGLATLAKLALFPILVEPRTVRGIYLLRGLVDGLFRHTGAIPAPLNRKPEP